VCHDSFICVPWLIHMCAMTRSNVCHDSFICVPWHIHMCAMTHSNVFHGSLLRVSGPIHMCAMNHSYVWVFSWLIYTCAMTRSCMCMTHSCVRHDSFMYVPWLKLACATTHSCVFHDSFICVPWLISNTWHDSLNSWYHPRMYAFAFTSASWLIRTCAMTHFIGWRDSLYRYSTTDWVRDISDSLPHCVWSHACKIDRIKRQHKSDLDVGNNHCWREHIYSMHLRVGHAYVLTNTTYMCICIPRICIYVYISLYDSLNS